MRFHVAPESPSSSAVRFYRVPAQGVGGTSCSEAFPRSSPRAAVGRWRRTGRLIGSDNILCRALELPAGTALWVHFRRPHPPQLLVYLDVQPGAAHCARLRVSLPAGFLQAFTSGPPSSSPALHRGAVVVTHLGFPGFPLVPMSLCPANHRCLCLAYNQWEVGGRRAEWLCPVGGTGRAMSGAGEQLRVPRCCPTGRGWELSGRLRYYSVPTPSASGLTVRKGPQASGC